MAFIGMPDRRLDSQGPQHAHAAYTQDNFLLQPRFIVTAVKPGGKLSVPALFSFKMSIQQIEPGLADIDLPDRHIDRSGVQVRL